MKGRRDGWATSAEKASHAMTWRSASPACRPFLRAADDESGRGRDTHPPFVWDSLHLLTVRAGNGISAGQPRTRSCPIEQTPGGQDCLPNGLGSVFWFLFFRQQVQIACQHGEQRRLFV